MEARKEVVCKMVALGMRTINALSIASIARSTYYYQSTGGKKGRRPLGFTILKGQIVPDREVVKSINDILGQEFIDYGYIRTTEALKHLGYKINKKKVYRLMKENKLLYPKRLVKQSNKEYVRYNAPYCFRPFELIEIDIKYIHIHGEKRNAYSITMLDVFTRLALVWSLNWDMKTQRVIELLKQLFDQWLIPLNLDPKKMKIKIRTDNGSQFIAHLFRNHLNDLAIENEYIRPGTPQQNGHIEAFHKTLQELVCRNYRLESFAHATHILNRFYDTYNNERIMKAILYKSPTQFFKLWVNGQIETKKINGKIKYLFREKKPENQASPSPEFLSMSGENIKQLNQCLTFR